MYYPVEFTLRDLLNETIRLAKENPTYRYESPIGYNMCLYTEAKDSKTKGCLLGQALINLDPTLRIPLDKEWSCSTIGIVLMYMFNRTEENIPTLNELCIIQRLQDQGVEWGKCILKT